MAGSIPSSSAAPAPDLPGEGPAHGDERTAAVNVALRRGIVHIE